MPQITSLTLTELLDAFASSDPVPAGGSAAALAGAAGAAVLIMAASLPKTRNGTQADAAALAAAAAELQPVRDTLKDLVDRDAAAYADVIAAIRIPRREGDSRRLDAIAHAMRAATHVPLETMRAGTGGMRMAVVVAGHASPAASGDIAAAVELLLAAVRGAGECVARNLAVLGRTEDVEQMAAEHRALIEESVTNRDRARAAL